MRLPFARKWLPCATGFAAILLTSQANGGVCFDSGVVKGVLHKITGAKDPTVAMSRKLPPVVNLAGSKIRIRVSKAASVRNTDAVETMMTKLRAELLKDRERGVSLVEDGPDTELRCRVTSLELTRQNQDRPNGNMTDTYTVFIGNVESSVEVYDMRTGRAIDSDNLKYKYEKWFLTRSTQTNQSRIPGFGRKPKTAKDERVPTDGEQMSDVLEGMARKVAQRLVPIDERFDVLLPGRFKDLGRYAEANNWGALKEKAESMTPLPKADEDSCRLYLVALATEAIAYGEKEPQKAQDLLVQASSTYEKAKASNPGEEYFTEPLNRVQESLERYLTMERINKLAKGARPRDVGAAAPVTPAGSAPAAAPGAMVYDNQYLITLKRKGSSDQFIISEIQDATAPKFDATPAGMSQLAGEGLSDDVKMAVKAKMRTAAAPAVRRSTPAKGAATKGGAPKSAPVKP